MNDMQTIPVQDYAIYLGSVFDSLNTFLEERKDNAIVIIVDENTKTGL